jgi:flagellar biosynthesis component FlhA
MPEHLCKLQLTLFLETSWWELAKPQAAVIAKATEERIRAMMRALGVPGGLMFEISSEQPRRQWLELRVGQTLCRYPDVLMNTVWAYTTGTHRGAEADLLQLLVQTRNAFERNSDTGVAFIARISEAIIALQPAVLLQDEQAQAYLRLLSEGDELGKPDVGAVDLKRILQAVLKSRCSLANSQIVKRALSSKRGDENAIIEEIIDEAQTGHIAIQAGSELFTSLSSANRQEELIAFTRNGMYEELGVLYPPITIGEDPVLMPNAFCFRINSLETIPILSVGAGKILVNDTSDRLQLLGVEATGTLNIATDLPASIVDISNRTMLEESGLTAWDYWEFVILALAEALREHGACFVSSHFTNVQLRKLARDAPKLVEIFLSEISVEFLTLVLRGLVEERVPIRDLKFILERLLDRGYAGDRMSRYVVLDDRLTSDGELMAPSTGDPEWNVDFVRAGLKAQLAHYISRKTGTLVVYLLSEEIENLVTTAIHAGDGGVSEFDTTRILGAIHAELSYLPQTASIPHLLTSGAIRRKMGKLVRAEMPRISVLAYAELPRDFNVQPVARISI